MKKIIKEFEFWADGLLSPVSGLLLIVILAWFLGFCDGFNAVPF